MHFGYICMYVRIVVWVTDVLILYMSTGVADVLQCT